MQLAAQSGTRRRKPNFTSSRTPGKSPFAFPKLRKRLPVAVQIDKSDRPTVVRSNGMIQERDRFPFGRESRRSNPANRFIEHVSDRIFQAALVTYAAHHREFAARRPV